jgi:hemerythrin
MIESDLLTHVDWIDEQHNELFDRLNALREISAGRMTKEAEEILHFLGKYVIKHFGDEERTMLEISYPQYEWHREWHQSYILKLQSLMEEYFRNGISPEYLQELITSIEDGISRHIINVDMLLGHYIRKCNGLY